MSAFVVWRQGVRRVRRATSLVLLLWIVTLAVTVPSAIVLHNEVTALTSQLEEAEERWCQLQAEVEEAL